MNSIQRHIAKKRDERGFTLIELLIVIIILGILAAVVIFAIGAVSDKGQLASCRTDAKTLRTAEEAVFNKKGGYKTEQGAGHGLVASDVITEPSELHEIVASGGTSPKDTNNADSDYTTYLIAAIGKCVNQSNAPDPDTAAGPLLAGTCPAANKCYKP